MTKKSHDKIFATLVIFTVLTSRLDSQIQFPMKGWKHFYYFFRSCGIFQLHPEGYKPCYRPNNSINFITLRK